MGEPVADGMEPIPVYGWAKEVVGSIRLARTVSTWLFVLSAVALGLGILAALATFLAFNDMSSSQDLSLSDSTDWSSLGQVSGTLLGTMLPVGLLAGAGALLRLQASRFETEMLDAEPIPSDGEDALA